MLPLAWLLLMAATCVNLASSTTPVIGVVLEETTPGKAPEDHKHLKETMKSLSIELNFTVQIIITTSPASFPSQIPGVVGLVAYGRCWKGGVVGVMEDLGVGVPVLSLMVESCGNLSTPSTLLPLYTLMDHQRTYCLPRILTEWVKGVLTRLHLHTPVVSPSTHAYNLTHALTHHLASFQRVGHQELTGCWVTSPAKDLSQHTPLRGQEYRAHVRATIKALLQGHVLTIVLKHRAPYVFLELRGRQVIGSSGILIELLHTLTQIYNFTYIMKLPDDGKWGSISSDGSWNGMVGEVHRNEMDMALGPTSITEEREKAIDFTTPFDFEPWDIMIPASQENVDLSAFLMPFSGYVWVGVMMSWIAVGVMLFLLSKSDYHLSVFSVQSSSGPRSPSVLRFLLESLGSLLSQSIRQPRSETVKVLSGWWWVFCVITIASYSSKLIASITVRFTTPPVTSLLQMVETQPIVWTYQANSAMEELFKYSEAGSMFGKVGQLHREREGLLVKSFKGGVEAVLEKEFAYIEDASLLEYAIADDLAVHGDCRMSLVGDHFFFTRFGMILQRKSPYREAFSYEILQFIQTGLMDAWKKRFWPGASRCVGAAAKRPVRALNFLDVAGTLLLLLGGLALSALLFLVEMMYSRCHGWTPGRGTAGLK
ncbi:probable glutamate receptor [Homarus americanus]|uniref:probable glutamate receptor n=1 Tax=Homarus americanus TaxID=6706 RepID=UPI001C44FD9D|nr:probable glutamate receptor [Homarus americanus]